MDSRDESGVRVGIDSVVCVLLNIVVEEVVQCDCPLWFTLGGNTQYNLCRRELPQTQVEQKLGYGGWCQDITRLNRVGYTFFAIGPPLVLVILAPPVDYRQAKVPEHIQWLVQVGGFELRDRLRRTTLISILFGSCFFGERRSASKVFDIVGL